MNVQKVDQPFGTGTEGMEHGQLVTGGKGGGADGDGDGGGREGHPSSNPIQKKDTRTRRRRPRAYIYTCTRNDSYRPYIDEPYDTDVSMPQDDDTCPTCNLTFFNFRNGEGLGFKGALVWMRRWKGHCVHCTTSTAFHQPVH